MLKKALSSLLLAGGALALVGMAFPNDEDYLSSLNLNAGLEMCASE